VKLLITYGRARPARLAALLAQRDACPYCGCDIARLVKHIISASHTQIWLACARCSAKGCGGGPQPHVPDHPRASAYPQWRPNMTEVLEPEEAAEFARTRISLVGFAETTTCIFRGVDHPRLLETVRAEARRDQLHVAVGLQLDDMLKLGRLFERLTYVVAEYSPATILLAVEPGLPVRALVPLRRGGGVLEWERIELANINNRSGTS
jgi:hypothetical protein